MAEAVTAGAVTAVPLLVVANTAGEAQRTARQAFIETLRSLYGIARNQVSHLAGGVRDIVRASPHALRALARTTDRALREVARISVISMRTFYRVVERATGTPESIVVAVLIYRLVDYSVSITPDGIVEFLDNIKRSVEGINITVPEIRLPTVDLSAWREGVHTVFETARRAIDNVKRELQVPEPGWIDIGCGAPPEWHDIPGQIRYGLCKIAEGMINGLVRLGYCIVSLALTVGRAILEFFKYLFTFIELVATGTVYMIEFLVNGSFRVFEFLVNSLLRLVQLVVNTVLSVIVKPLVVVVIDYVLKPLAVFLVNGFNWIKNSMKTCLCWYLRASPFLLGFRLAIRDIARRMEKGGGFGLLDLFRTGLFRTLAVFTASTLSVTILLTILVPECSLIPTAEAVMPAPEPPSPATLERVPVAHYSIVRIGVSVAEEYSAVIPAVYTSVVSIRTSVAERVVTRVPLVHYASLSVRVDVSETARASKPLAKSATLRLKVTVTE